MGKEIFKNILTRLFNSAGVTVNGNEAWDIQVHHDDFYRKTLTEGSLGLGEAYMSRWWDSPQPDEFITRILRSDLEHQIKPGIKLKMDVMLSRIFNRQQPAEAFRNGSRHYDIGNDLFVLMLDKRMTYTCGFWNNARSLNEAQENKLDLTCRKLRLRPGMHVLDIGCGWGSFARFAAENYGVRVTGITISKEQAELGRQICNGLPVDIRIMDYRSLHEQFDAVVSIGMFEHVGYKNYRTYMKMAHQNLKEGGLFLLHTIGSNRTSTLTDPWINKYIFPNSLIPSIRQIGEAIDGLFVMEHWENFSVDYDKTLMAWHENINANWERLKGKYDATFFRMWKYYLLSCAGAFRSRSNQLWQVVLSKSGVPGGYSFG